MIIDPTRLHSITTKIEYSKENGAYVYPFTRPNLPSNN